MNSNCNKLYLLAIFIHENWKTVRKSSISKMYGLVDGNVKTCYVKYNK